MIAVKELVRYLGDVGFLCRTVSDGDMMIDGYSALSDIKSNSITWVKDPEFCNPTIFDEVSNVVVVSSSVIAGVNGGVGQLITSNPKAAFFSVVREFFTPRSPVVMSSTAVIETTKVGKDVSIGHHSYICAAAEIADGVLIGNNVSIECPCKIGQRSRIGSGSVIGNDGYGFYKDASGVQRRVPHNGGVTIGSDVEIDANVCIDRGTIGDTVIGDHVKINNQCHIAHNVKICDFAMILARVSISGSTVIGPHAYVAPGCVIMNQKNIGENSLIGMGSVVVKDVPASKVVMGVPAKIVRDNK